MASRRKKIEYLHNYKSINVRIDILANRLMTLKNMDRNTLQSPAMSDMPRGGSRKDINGVADIVARVDDMVQLENEIRVLSLESKRIINKLHAVSNLQYRNILELRYVDNVPFKEIAGILNLGDQHVFVLHRRAIDTFPLDNSEIRRLEELLC